MAGNEDAADNIPDHKPVKPVGRTFSCPNCGASVSIRYAGQALSVSCDSCRSVIDVTDPNYSIICRYREKVKRLPRIELGTRGELFGKKWEVIGFLVRQDSVSSYEWEEYLLYNPYYGYRWLAHADGHWNFVTTIKDRPDYRKRGWSESNIYHQGKNFKEFFNGGAVVAYVLGEFYWKVKVDQKVKMADYIAPPLMLSKEEDGNEVVWSMSEYVKRDVIKKAFNADVVDFSSVVAPNQPSAASASLSKIACWWLLFVVLLTCAQVTQAVSAMNSTVLSTSFPFITNVASTQTTTSPVFQLDKPQANVEIDASCGVDNAWFYVSGELVNDDTGVTYPFDRSIEYYHGYEDGEYWSEGGTATSLLIPGVPGGKYYLNLDNESGQFASSGAAYYTLTVKRDVGTFANYFWCLLFLSIIPGYVWWLSHTFEVKRWSTSDFSPYMVPDSYSSYSDD